jgi:hypothetical protein
VLFRLLAATIRVLEARAVLLLWSRVISKGDGKSRTVPYVAVRFMKLIVAARVQLHRGSKGHLPTLVHSRATLGAEGAA